MTKKTLYILLLLLVPSISRAEGEQAFRGAWIATVANIDWPSTTTIGNPPQQRAEMIQTLDSLAAIGVNAIVFQVRPTADALYISELEPISHWLTGKQGSWGEAEPWDPLEFVCQQAHERGMQVHVWLNPYRVNIASMNISLLTTNHVYRMHPEWFFHYGQQWYFDPGLDETRDWVCSVVEDIVTRYDIEAVHMDDYFYPYPIGNTPLPDAATFAAHPRGFTNIRDWRRNNVNMAIREISTTIRAIKPEVEFGISPFGVWKNGGEDGSATQAGITNYDHLYADIVLWMREGWIDYVLPQLYWEIGKKTADYEILAHWWADRTREANEHLADLALSDPTTEPRSIKLYIGMAPYRLGEQKGPTAWRTGNEIARQIRLNRTIPEISGECLYSTRPLLKNPLHVCDSVRCLWQEQK